MSRTKRRGLKVAVVGATGMVGRELLPLLESGRLPIARLFPFSSGKSRKELSFRGRRLAAPAPDRRVLEACDLVFFVSSDEVSLRLAPQLSARGVWVIDDSSAFRLDPRVPLVIPEVNASALSPDARLIAGPNCTMTGLAVAGAPLHAAFGVRAVRLASYQSVSGAGKAALAEFLAQNRAFARSLRPDAAERAPALKAPASKALPSAIAFNVFPQVGSFDAAGDSSEERKVAAELRKVWGAPDLKVSVTAVRVPTIRGHGLSAWLTLAKPCPPARARALLAKAPGLALAKDGRYPTPLSRGGREGVEAGRVRAGVDASELCLWIVSDNLLKGAALNSVQIAEELLRRGWLRPA